MHRDHNELANAGPSGRARSNTSNRDNASLVEASDPIQKPQKRAKAAFSETLMVQVPAMVLAMEAADAFQNQSSKSKDQLHEIESYGPVGFDFVELENSQPSGPFVISESVLDAVASGQTDMELAMSVYWDDVPKVIGHDLQDADWIEAELASLAFDPIDQIDLSFGVVELPLDAFFPDAAVPIVDDFFA